MELVQVTQHFYLNRRVGSIVEPTLKKMIFEKGWIHKPNPPSFLSTRHGTDNDEFFFALSHSLG